jgi:hypothetical protein
MVPPVERNRATANWNEAAVRTYMVMCPRAGWYVVVCAWAGCTRTSGISNTGASATSRVQRTLIRPETILVVD